MPSDDRRLIGFEPDTRPLGPDTKAPVLWLILSIASTVCFCLPFGLVGLVYSALALSARETGRWEAMNRHVRVARGWTIAAFGVGFGFFLLTAWWSAQQTPT